MFGIGGAEFVIIALVALFIFGPDRLPGAVKSAARMLHDVRRWTTKARADLTDTLGPEFENFDLADDKTWAPALDGVDSVFLLVPGGVVDAYAFAAPFLTAATKQQKKVVLMTALGVDAAPVSPYARLEQLLTS